MRYLAVSVDDDFGDSDRLSMCYVTSDTCGYHGGVREVSIIVSIDHFWTDIGEVAACRCGCV